ncbi:MAG: hypothetical protein ACR2NZ_19640, partial [Rubripirellula sp.]
DRSLRASEAHNEIDRDNVSISKSVPRLPPNPVSLTNATIRAWQTDPLNLRDPSLVSLYETIDSSPSPSEVKEELTHGISHDCSTNWKADFGDTPPWTRSSTEIAAQPSTQSVSFACIRSQFGDHSFLRHNHPVHEHGVHNHTTFAFTPLPPSVGDEDEESLGIPSTHYGVHLQGPTSLDEPLFVAPTQDVVTDQKDASTTNFFDLTHDETFTLPAEFVNAFGPQIPCTPTLPSRPFPDSTGNHISLVGLLQDSNPSAAACLTSNLCSSIPRNHFTDSEWNHPHETSRTARSVGTFLVWNIAAPESLGWRTQVWQAAVFSSPIRAATVALNLAPHFVMPLAPSTDCLRSLADSVLIDRSRSVPHNLKTALSRSESTQLILSIADHPACRDLITNTSVGLSVSSEHDHLRFRSDTSLVQRSHPGTAGNALQELGISRQEEAIKIPDVKAGRTPADNPTDDAWDRFRAA